MCEIWFGESSVERNRNWDRIRSVCYQTAPHTQTHIDTHTRTSINKHFFYRRKMKLKLKTKSKWNKNELQTRRKMDMELNRVKAWSTTMIIGNRCLSIHLRCTLLLLMLCDNRFGFCFERAFACMCICSVFKRLKIKQLIDIIRKSQTKKQYTPYN